MQADYWQEKWAAGSIGFHQSKPNKRLMTHWPELSRAPGSAVFVPLCGKSLDMLWLHQQGHAVLGIELAESAVVAFFEENQLSYERRQQGQFERFSGTGAARGLELLVGDYFALSAGDLADCDGFYDRAALIAMNDELRRDYADQLGKILRPGVEGLTLTIEYDSEKMQGPPFSVPDATLQSLFAPNFSIDLRAQAGGPELLGKLADRGLDTLQERVYRLSRRTD